MPDKLHMNGGHENGDLGQLQATMQAIEYACSSIQINVNPAAAEATILSLCQSPRPYKSCHFIIVISDDLSPSADRANMRKFRKNL